ncbi:hypothetical protein GW7_16673 [Heterocephalus glaber]|uniref:Uncharacterized protein n=1 Tax=Heterocephalus glaber TaxID=10181 RepID=G5C7A4_HETGA|nr:hypothetical protein GW7_16673 [Heterocephalus glaber]
MRAAAAPGHPAAAPERAAHPGSGRAQAVTVQGARALGAGSSVLRSRQATEADSSKQEPGSGEEKALAPRKGADAAGPRFGLELGRTELHLRRVRLSDAGVPASPARCPGSGQPGASACGHWINGI